MENIYLARQPIFNIKQDVIGYELLYRSSDSAHANVQDHDLASSTVIINAFINIGMENIVGSNLAFINLPRTFIVDKQLLPMTSEQVALEVLESVGCDDEVIHALENLSEQGYLIALDDFVYDDSLRPLLKVANIVKIDLTMLDEEQIREHVELLSEYDVKLLAEKIETREQYEFCKQLGFEYFQGFYFCRPNIIKGKDIPVNKAVLFQVIQTLQDQKMTMDELERLLVQDVTLSYKLMRYINSASFSFRKEIESVKQALVIMGLDSIRNWATLIVLSNINTDKPFELIRTALVRAKMGELLAKESGVKDKNQMFTVGLFSLLDAVMDIPMIELLDTISLTAPIKMALLDKEGELGELLEQILLYENGEWFELKKRTDNPAIFKQAYLGALKWADETSRFVKS